MTYTANTVCTVHVDAYPIKIAECPSSGIEALDYRREHGLPDDRADNVVLLDLRGGEPELRALVGAGADASATELGHLEIRKHGDVLGHKSGCLGYLPRHAYASGYRLELAPDAVKSLVAAEPEDRCHLLAALAKARAAVLSAEAEERAAKEEAMKAEREAERAEKRRRHEEEAQREEAERVGWIGAHGSKRLQRLAAEGIECGAVYRDERLAHDRPGWRWVSEVNGEDGEPRNPPEEALDLLDEARATLPEGVGSELVHWTVDACEGPHDYHEDDVCPGQHEGWRGYAVTSRFLGRWIVYGGPE